MREQCSLCNNLCCACLILAGALFGGPETVHLQSMMVEADWAVHEARSLLAGARRLWLKEHQCAAQPREMPQLAAPRQWRPWPVRLRSVRPVSWDVMRWILLLALSGFELHMRRVFLGPSCNLMLPPPQKKTNPVSCMCISSSSCKYKFA